MQNIQKQITRLYLSTVLGSLSLTGAWVAILAARGYTLVEIGFAETVFHITSLILENSVRCPCRCIRKKKYADRQQHDEDDR